MEHSLSVAMFDPQQNLLHEWLKNKRKETKANDNQLSNLHSKPNSINQFSYQFIRINLNLSPTHTNRIPTIKNKYSPPKKLIKNPSPLQVSKKMQIWSNHQINQEIVNAWFLIYLYGRERNLTREFPLECLQVLINVLEYQVQFALFQHVNNIE